MKNETKILDELEKWVKGKSFYGVTTNTRGTISITSIVIHAEQILKKIKELKEVKK